jgi:N,N'-diacetyllegionaminate synthase
VVSDLALAKEFIWRFAEAGADFVKFQTTRVKHLRPDDPQYDWFRRAELSDDAHHELKAECEKAGTQFLTTVYHADEVPFVRSICDVVKIGSGEAGERSVVRAVKGAGFRRVLISDGLGQPLGHAHELLRCITRYPAPHGLVPVKFVVGGYEGWSDHCVGIESCQVAILRGAHVIEKHVCLPQQARPVRSFEATVEQFKELRAFADDDPTRFVGRWQMAGAEVMA